jgi:hypothetical protein
VETRGGGARGSSTVVPGELQLRSERHGGDQQALARLGGGGARREATQQWPGSSSSALGLLPVEDRCHVEKNLP